VGKKTGKGFRWIGGGLGVLALLLLVVLGAHPWIMTAVAPWALDKAGLEADTIEAQGYRALQLEGLHGTVAGYTVEGDSLEVPLLFPYLSYFLADEPSDDVLIRGQNITVEKTEPSEAKEDTSGGEPMTPQRLSRLIDQLIPKLQHYLPGTQLENVSYQGYQSSWRLKLAQAEWQPVEEALQADGQFIRNEQPRDFSLSVNRGERWTYALDLTVSDPTIALEGEAALKPTGWQLSLDGQLYGGPTEISASLPEDAWLPDAAHLSWENPQDEIAALTSRGVNLEQGQLELDWDGQRWAVDTQANGTYAQEEAEPTPWEVDLVAQSEGAPTARIQELDVQTKWADAQLRHPVTFNWETYELDNPAQLRARVPIQPYLKEGEWPPLMVDLRARPLRRGQGLEYKANFSLPDNAPLPGQVELRGSVEQGQLVLEQLQADLAEVGTLQGNAKATRGDSGFNLEQVQLSWDFDGEALRQRLPQLQKLVFVHTTGQLQGQGTWPNLSYSGEAELQQVDVPQVNPLNLTVSLEGKGLDQVTLKPHIQRDEANDLQLAVQLNRTEQAWELGVQELQWHHDQKALQLAAPFSVEVSRNGPMQIQWTAADLSGPPQAPKLAWQKGQWTTAEGGGLQLEMGQWNGEWLTPWLETDLPRAGVDQLAIDIRTENEAVVGTLQFAGSYWIEEQDLPLRADIKLEPGKATFQTLQAGAPDRTILNATGSLPFSLAYRDQSFSYQLDQDADFQFDLDLNLDRPRVHRVLKPLGVQLGRADAQVELSGSITQPQGQIRLRAQSVDYDNPALKEAVRLDDVNLNAHIEPDTIEVPLLAFVLREYNRDHVRLSAQVSNLDLEQIINAPGEAHWQEIDYRVQVDRLPIAALMPVASNVVQPQGSFFGEVRWRGGAFRPSELNFENIAFQPMGGGLTLRSFHGTLGLDGRNVSLNDVKGQWSGQPLQLGGQLNFDNFKQPTGKLALKGERLELVRQAGLLLRGDVDVQAQIQQGLQQVGLTGKVNLHDSMLLRDMRDLLRSGPASAASEPPFFSVDTKPFNAWTIDLGITGDQFMRIQAPFVSGELSADLRLEGTLGDPRLIGEIPLQPGAVRFPFAKIPLDTAAARITLEQPHTVQLSASGQGYSFGYDVQLTVEGTMSEPELRLNSTPPLSEESILMMLTTGSVPQNNSSSVDSEGSSGLQRAGSLAYYVGQDVFSPLFQGGGSSRIRIMQGGSLSQFGQRTTAVEFQLTDDFSLIGEYDEYGDYNIDFKWDIFER